MSSLEDGKYVYMVDVDVTAANLEALVSGGTVDINLADILLDDTDVILVKTVNGKYFFLRVTGVYSASGTTGDFYPGEVKFEMSWDEDGDGVPEKIPGGPVYVPAE